MPLLNYTSTYLFVRILTIKNKELLKYILFFIKNVNDVIVINFNLLIIFRDIIHFSNILAHLTQDTL